MYHNFCIHTSTEGLLGSFQLLAIINRAAMNILVHLSLLCIKVFFFKELYKLHYSCNDLIFSSDAKERPCVITSCCHRGSVPDKDEVCTVPRVNEGRKLFGQELSSICCEGKFPTSILVGFMVYQICWGNFWIK